MEKEKLLRAVMENYTNKDIINNPLLCAEAIGFLEACKIVIPEDTEIFDELIDSYTLLCLLTTSEQ